MCIDKTGTVAAITDHHEVNAVAIKKMLAESGQALVQKKDAMKPYDPEAPLLFQPLDIQRKQILFQSLLSS